MDVLQKLSAMLGQEAVLSGALTRDYFNDYRGRYQGQALAVVFPDSTAQVAQLVKFCSDYQLAIVPQGGNTSLCGGSVPLADDRPQLVVNLSRLRKIRELDSVNYTMTVEAGCTLEEVCQAAAAQQRLFPLGLNAIASRCEIGGNIATNAGGVGVLRYGNMRDLVLGLEVVLPDGQIWHGLNGLRKNNTGYDLKHIFIGSEGTLGIVTAAVLKLFPQPQTEVSACVAIRDPQAAVDLLAHVRASCGDTLSAFELVSRSTLNLVLKHIPQSREPFVTAYDYYVLVKVSDVMDRPLDDALRQALQRFGSAVAEFEVSSESAVSQCWWDMRKSINEAQKREGISVKHDVSVPVSRVATFIRETDRLLCEHYPGVRIVAFGHMGDGNIHYNVSMPDVEANRRFIAEQEAQVNRLVYRQVAKLEGSISAEHGLGQLKRLTIHDYKQPLELQMMRHIKQQFDPEGMMNPGKLL